MELVVPSGATAADLLQHGPAREQGTAPPPVTGVLVESTERSARPADDYAAKGSQWLMNVHVSTFPNGKGLCPAGLSFERYLTYLIRRYPREQHASPWLIAHAFDIMRRHSVNQEGFTQLRMSPGTLSLISTLKPEQIEGVVELLKASQHPTPALREAIEQLEPNERALYRSYHKTTARIPGSPPSLSQLRSRAYSLWYGQGMFTISLNINPASCSAKLAFDIAGRTYVLTPQGNPGPDYPAKMERFRILARDPLAVAQYFHVCLRSFAETFLDWDFDAQAQRTPDPDRPCPFGVITGFYFKPEANKRAEPHAHGGAIQPHMQPAALVRWIQSKEMQEQLLQWMESVSAAFLPAPFTCKERGIVDPSSSDAQPVDIKVPTPQQYATGSAVPPSAREYPLPDLDAMGTTLSEAELQAMTRHQAEVALYCQVHEHRDTCRQGGHAGTDDDCRMVMPRNLMKESKEHEGHVLLKRTGGHLVNHCPALHLALPYNHAIYFNCEVSRWLREHTLWQRLHDQGSRAEEPTLARPEQTAALNAEYSLKYHCKFDADASSTILWHVAKVRDARRSVACRALLTCMLGSCMPA